jgi:SAM-dependent methyltransferase
MVETWHYGLVARWWGAFNEGGDDAEFFRRFVERTGGPALDVGCGAGRVLLPCIEAGLDVEGLDASADMLAECQRLAGERGVSPTLHCQPMHEMRLERRYASMFMCGAFGLGAGRREDLATIARCFEHLEPGGVLAQDLYLPTNDKRTWGSWIEKPDMPRNWPEKSDRRALPDGTELDMQFRRTAFDPIAQSWRGEIRIRHLDGDNLLADEVHSLTGMLYFTGEVVTMLEATGFVDVEVRAGFEDRDPVPYEDHYLVITARRPN